MVIQGRTLEEINEIFEDPKPVKKSLQLQSSENVLQTVLDARY
jgi:hypothetical protein